jgi:hypothetical protein
MMWCLLKAKTAIPAWTSTWLIQVDKDLRMSEGTSTAITNSLSSMHDPDGFGIYHLHGTQRLRLQIHSSLLKSRAFTADRTRTLTG